MKSFEDFLNEAQDTYEVEHKTGGFTTVKARSEKEAITRAVKNLRLGRLAREKDKDFTVKKVD